MNLLCKRETILRVGSRSRRPDWLGSTARSARQPTPMKPSHRRCPISAPISTAKFAQFATEIIRKSPLCRSEEHTSELQSLMRNSYAVFCLKKKKKEHTYE